MLWMLWKTVFKNLQYHSDTGLGVGNSKTGVPNCVYGDLVDSIGEAESLLEMWWNLE